MDQHRQEPGCPNECLKLQAGVVSSCTSLGIPEEEDWIKFPLSAYGVHVEWQPGALCLGAEWFLALCWQRALLAHNVKEVESQVLSTDSWHLILHCSVSLPTVSLWYFWIWRKGLYSESPCLTLEKKLFCISWAALRSSSPSSLSSEGTSDCISFETMLVQAPAAFQLGSLILALIAAVWNNECSLSPAALPCLHVGSIWEDLTLLGWSDLQVCQCCSLNPQCS